MKKLLSIIIAAAMLPAVTPCIASADGGTVISITAGPGYQADVNHNGMTVTPEINVVSGETPAGYKYQWYAQNNGGAKEEYILPWETGPSITIHSQIPSGWWLWFEATPLDAEGNAIGDSVKVRYVSTFPMKGRTDFPGPTAEQSEAWHDTPSEYLFEVDGVQFILLDRLYNGEYYVMTEHGMGEKRVFDTRGNGNAFNPAASQNIGYWLNNDFLSGNYLPASVKSHITEGNWTTEGDHPDWGNSNKTYKIGLLSYSEYIQYLGRFGVWLPEYASWPTDWEGFWLRTLRSNAHAFGSAKNGGTDKGTGIPGTLYYYGESNTAQYARPTFRLSSDFFNEVKVNADSVGDKVKDTIKEVCTTGELRSLYTDEELAKIDPSLAFSYAVDKMSVRDASNGRTTVSFDLIRYGDSVDSEYAFVAAYNSGRLVGIKSFPINLKKGAQRYVSMDMGVIEDGYDDIKLMCFDPRIMKPTSKLMTLYDAMQYSESEGDAYCDIVMPNTIYGVAGREMNLYFANSIYCNDLKDYQIDVECSKGMQQEERWTYTSENAESFNLTLNIYQDATRLITSKTVPVKVIGEESHDVLVNGADTLLVNAIAQRMNVVNSNPDSIVVVVDDDETKQDISDRITALKAQYSGVAIGIVPPIYPTAPTQMRKALLDDIDSLIKNDNTLFLIPAGWNVDGVYSCDQDGINSAGAQQAADIIYAAVCDKGGSK